MIHVRVFFIPIPPKPQPLKPQIHSNTPMLNSSLFSSATCEWCTPKDLFKELDQEFHFTLDPCSTDENHLCPTYFTAQQDGLAQDWGTHTVYCNPPYGREIHQWVRKCAEHRGLAVMLIPARTDTTWFHSYIYKNPRVEIRFLKGRLHFNDSKHPAPFPSMIVVFRPKDQVRN